MIAPIDQARRPVRGLARRLRQGQFVTQTPTGAGVARLSLPDLDDDAVDGEDRTEAEQAAWAWYLEWSTIARQAVTDRNALRELGFLRPTGKNDLGDNEEIDPIALAASTSPAAATGAVAASTGGAAPAPAPVVTSAAGPSAASSTAVP